MTEDIRIDKWLWAVRIYKTRSIAIDEINKGRVLVDGDSVKPSRNVKEGMIILVRKPPVIYTYKVKALLKNRVSADKVTDYLENHTSNEEMLKLTLAKADINFRRDKGTGRPTKKDRRLMDRMRE